MDLYYGVIIKWVGILFIGSVVSVVLFLIVWNAIRAKKHKEAGGTFNAPEDDTPVVVNDIWTKIHNEVGISFFIKKMVPRTGREEDLNIAIGEMEEKIFYFPPKYELKDNGILLRYPDKTGAKTPRFDLLKSITPEYASALYRNGLSPYPELFPEQMERKDEIFFRFVTEKDALELKIYNITDNAGLLKTDPMGRTVRPKIWFDGDDLMFDTTNCALTADELMKPCAKLSAEFSKNYQAIEKEGDYLFRMPHIKPRPRAFKIKKDNPTLGAIAINPEVSKRIFEIRKKLEDETKIRWCFMGEVLDPVVKIEAEYYGKKAIQSIGPNGEEGLFLPITEIRQIKISGMTGSGKSAGVSSFFYYNTNIEDIAIFGDADKDGIDFYPISIYHSPLPIIKKTTEYGDDHMVLFGNAFSYIWKEYMRRKSLLSKAKKVNIFEYNNSTKDEKLPWVFFLIDEFVHFHKEVGMNATGDTKGGLGSKLEKLLSGARAYGITVILASQGAYVDTYPTHLSRNLTCSMIYVLEGNERNKFPEMENIDLDKGEYLLKLNGVNCKRTGKSLIKCSLPYIGDSDVVLKLFAEKCQNTPKEKEPVDYELIVPKGDENFEDKVDPKDLWRFLKKLFFKEQGFKVDNLIGDKRITDVHFCAVLEDTGNEYFKKEFEGKILFGLFNKDYDISEHLFRKPSNKNLIEKINPHLILIFTNFEFKQTEVEKLKDNGFIPKNCVFLKKSLYAKDLNKALGDYENGEKDEAFREILRDVWVDFEADETEEKVRLEREVEAKVKASSPTKKDKTLPTVEDKIKEQRIRQELFRQKVKEHLAKKMKKISPIEQEATKKIIPDDQG